MQEGQADVPLEGYIQFWNSAERKKKGYSEQPPLTLKEPLSVQMTSTLRVTTGEGRTIHP